MGIPGVKDLSKVMDRVESMEDYMKHLCQSIDRLIVLQEAQLKAQGIVID